MAQKGQVFDLSTKEVQQGGVKMYDGNQVLRFEIKYKAKDLGGLGVELTQRKGAGN